MTSIDELNPGLEGIGRYEFGWHDADTAGAVLAVVTIVAIVVLLLIVLRTPGRVLRVVVPLVAAVVVVEIRGHPTRGYLA